jgi:hypothetical protein
MSNVMGLRRLSLVFPERDGGFKLEVELKPTGRLLEAGFGYVEALE